MDRGFTQLVIVNALDCDSSGIHCLGKSSAAGTPQHLRIMEPGSEVTGTETHRSVP